MTSTNVKARSASIVLLGSALVACAAGRKSADAPQAGAPPEQAPAAYAQQQPGAAASPPAAPAPPPPGADEAERSATQPATPTSRKVALSQATNDIEASQRELDVAGGDCRNACRALGSMDRAAGRICGLAQSDDEMRRCGDAKTRLYSARNKVKNTCGSCPDVSVDRDAPIPSR